MELTYKDGKYYDKLGKVVSKDELRPTMMKAVNLDHFGGASALEKMREEGKIDEEFVKMLPSTDGVSPDLPPDLTGKSLAELKALGA